MQIELSGLQSVSTLRQESFDNLFSALASLESQLENLGKSIDNEHIFQNQLKTATESWKAQSQSISNQWKDSYANICKIGKSLDKKFKVSAEELSKFSGRIESNVPLYTALAHHFYRSGHFELADVFIKESNSELDESTRMKYYQLYTILEALDHSDLGPAIDWADKIHDKLKMKGSDLEFQFHKVQFLTLVAQGQTQEALLYSKTRFIKFTEKNQKEIQRLMGCLAYTNRLNQSPYANLFENGLPYDKLRASFIKEYSAWMGLPFESPIELCVNIGQSALPKILKVSSLMKDKAIEWTTVDELPVEIPIPDSAKFHSVFSCPVLKEPSSASNPPMMMPCGHVLSKDALHRLSKSASIRFKCPYCPNESILSQAVRVYL